MPKLSDADAIYVGGQAVDGVFTGNTQVWPAAETSSTLADDGVWTWYTDPRAVCHDGARRAMYVGYVRADGDAVVASLDLDTRRLQEYTVRWTLHADDHCNPAVFVRPDGRIMTFYTRHDDRALRYRVTVNPEDITSWQPEKSVTTITGFTGYSNPYYIASESRLYMFTRNLDFSPTVVYTDDMGATWSTPRQVFDAPATAGHRPYLKYASNGTRIDFFATDGHPRDVPTGEGDMYHWYMEGGNFYKTDGTLIRSLASLATTGPLTEPEVTEFHDRDTEGGTGWTWSIEYQSNGHPIVTYAVYAANDNNIYKWAFWNGSSWTKRTLLSGVSSIYGTGSVSEPQYTGGIIVDPLDTNAVYLSNKSSGQWEIERWVTSDAGQNWTVTAITSGSSGQQFRPYVPRNWISGAPNLLWAGGPYTSFTNYATAIKMRPAASVRRVPAARAAPTISGANRVGQTLTCSTGTWVNSPATYTYQWYRNSVAIVGATSSTYVVQTADVGAFIECTVTASNATGVGRADSGQNLFAILPTSVGAWGWWRADSQSGLADGGTVDFLADYSTNARHLFPASNTARPKVATNSLNSLPTIRFDGVDDALTIAQALGLTGDMSLFIVAKTAVSGHIGSMLSTRNGNTNGWIYRLRSDINSTIYANVSRTPNVGAGGYDASQFHLHEIVRTGTSVVAGVNGTMNSAVTVSGAPVAGTPRFDVGGEAVTAGSPTSNPFNGYIAEIITFDTALSTANRDAVESYIATKYGLTIA